MSIGRIILAMNTADLRVQRTRRLLREALIELVSSQGYESITIRDITQRAQVGYKTFFRHYTSKEALLQTILDEIVADFQKALLSPAAPNASDANTLVAVQFAKDYRELLLMLMHSAKATQLLAPLTALGLAESQRFFSGTKLPDALVAHHFTASMLSLLQWWLEHDMPYSVEEMAGYLNQLLIQPIKTLTAAGLVCTQEWT